MIGLYTCRCTSFRWVQMPTTITMTVPICHGAMRFAWRWMSDGAAKDRNGD